MRSKDASRCWANSSAPGPEIETRAYDCWESLMGIILGFPSKEDFVSKFADSLPSQIIDCVKKAYDDIVGQAGNLPSVEVKVDPDYIEPLNKFKEEYRALLLALFEQTLQKDAEICLLRYRLAKYEAT